jgi:hypothetical protein
MVPARPLLLRFADVLKRTIATVIAITTLTHKTTMIPPRAPALMPELVFRVVPSVVPGVLGGMSGVCILGMPEGVSDGRLGVLLCVITVTAEPAKKFKTIVLLMVHA